MISSEVGRTLVKSPPELWSELSDARALSRHLGEFGEIRITRIEPEKTVEWESDSARGTVQIKASGWGTRVTLTVDRELPASDAPPPIDDEECGAGDEHDAAATPHPAGDEPPAAGEPVAGAPVAGEPAVARPAAGASGAPVAEAAGASDEQTRAPIESAAEEPPAQLEAVRPPFEQFQPLLPRDLLTAQSSRDRVDDKLDHEIEAQEPDPQPRERFLRRLLGRLRRKNGDPPLLAALEDPAPDPEPVPVAQKWAEGEDAPAEELQIIEQTEPAREPGAQRESTPDRDSAPEPAAETGAEPPSAIQAQAPTEVGLEKVEQTGLAAELRAAEEVAAAEVRAVLASVLDRLGTAHHRPFSRP